VRRSETLTGGGCAEAYTAPSRAHLGVAHAHAGREIARHSWLFLFSLDRTFRLIGILLFFVRWISAFGKASIVAGVTSKFHYPYFPSEIQAIARALSCTVPAVSVCDSTCCVGADAVPRRMSFAIQRRASARAVADCWIYASLHRSHHVCGTADDVAGSRCSCAFASQGGGASIALSR